MPRVHAAVRAGFRTLATVAPPLAVEAAFAAFRRVGPPGRVRDQDRAVHERARRGTLHVRGHEVVTYAWGDPAAPPVLLVHGWKSRASRFAALTADLEAAGLQVLAFDGVAHGSSAGRTTTILDHLEILNRIADRPAGLAAVVGHSFGAFAAGVALHEGLPARNFTAVAAVPGFDHLTSSFAGAVGLPDRLREPLARRISSGAFPGEPDPRTRFDLLLNPAPEAVPTLFVHDAGDREVTHAHAHRLHAAHPGSRLVVTSGLGHNRVLDAPEVRAMIVEHVTSSLHPATS
ncbi:alpha/beta hydrolase [Antribacter sp. KLBMP9083]|uniref:Alpha/beta hydrolase n=1 Tax=Antribacter soli TaxID=2910976 RepID=A0AA41U7T8_9MICO|nr:alpha/beta fold hydrolase [Antribacter soli]MCF4121951.1 alpha/beta hydrolase [Antribacter soli]